MFKVKIIERERKELEEFEEEVNEFLLEIQDDCYKSYTNDRRMIDVRVNAFCATITYEERD